MQLLTRSTPTYRPNFVITFLHRPGQDPRFASFIVPLWFSKFDLKDYLFNLYGVKALRIRSLVEHAPLQQGKDSDIVRRPRKYVTTLVSLIVIGSQAFLYRPTPLCSTTDEPQLVPPPTQKENDHRDDQRAGPRSLHLA